ncbi:hypothetical protein RZS08_40245, partial [Arthrospira platensis SPKY1]|nr:hypothetical protein [Arthrospira platensis SPKY1]
MKIDFNNNNNTYFLLKKEDYDNCYFLGSTVKYNEVFNRRLNLRYNIQQYICDNCNYHSYSNIRIAQLYLTLTLEIIDTFNKGLISIFNNNKVYKEIPYNKYTFK